MNPRGSVSDAVRWGQFLAAVHSQCVNAQARLNIRYQRVLQGALLGHVCAPCERWRRPRRLGVVPSAEHHVLAAVLAAWLLDVCFAPRWEVASAARTGGL
jgi:hypothetical protein